MQTTVILMDVARRRALLMVFLLFISCIIMLIVTFVKPWFLRTPYAHYKMQYYYDYAKYAGDSKKFDFSDCDNQSKADIYAPLWCNRLLNTGKSSFILTVLSIIMLFFTLTMIGFKLKSRQFLINNNFLWFVLFVCFVTYVLLTSSFISFVASWPYTKFCAYGGDDTGCTWSESVYLTMVVGALLIIAMSIVFSLICPICAVIFPCLRPAEERQPIVANVNTFENEFSDTTQQNRQLKNSSQKKCCLSWTLAECLSILFLAITLTTTHVVLSLLLTFKWHNATYHGQRYVDNQWRDAMCNNNGSFYEPFDSTIEGSCSFSFPLGNTTQHYWTCCTNTECSSAFNYTSLFNGYDSWNDSCLIDMKAMTKASCHPLRYQFVGSSFDITQSPLNKNNVTFANSVAVCHLFCEHTYDDCKDKFMNNTTKTVGSLFSSASEFCHQALGVVSRYEIFTDECFAGCSMLKVGYVFVTILLIWSTM